MGEPAGYKVGSGRKPLSTGLWFSVRGKTLRLTRLAIMTAPITRRTPRSIGPTISDQGRDASPDPSCDYQRCYRHWKAVRWVVASPPRWAQPQIS